LDRQVAFVPRIDSRGRPFIQKHSADSSSECSHRFKRTTTGSNQFQSTESYARNRTDFRSVSFTIDQFSYTGYDKHSDKPNPTGKPRRSVFQSETLFGDNTDIDDDVILEDESFEFEYDVDTMPAELQAYAMDRRERPQFKPGSRMWITRWKAFSEKAKQIWDTMEDDDKALILALQENRKDALKPDQSKYSVNTHSFATDTSSDDIDDAF
jgi:hypothetical protein